MARNNGNNRLIRSDGQGVYVITGGYVFRPVEPSKYGEDETIRAQHVGGTQTAKVGDELWRSYSGDWQYRVVVYPDGVPDSVLPYLEPLPAMENRRIG